MVRCNKRLTVQKYDGVRLGSPCVVFSVFTDIFLLIRMLRVRSYGEDGNTSSEFIQGRWDTSSVGRVCPNLALIQLDCNHHFVGGISLGCLGQFRANLPPART